MEKNDFPIVAWKKAIVTMAILGLTSLVPLFSGQAFGDAAKLLGKWVGRTDFGELVLEFRSANQLVFENETASYRLLPGIIRVQDEDGTTDYRYTFRGEALVIAFPEGFQVEFTRVGAPPKTAAPAPPAKSTTPPPAPPAPGGDKPAVAASAQVGTGEAGDPGWGFKFRPPAGWKFQKSAEAVILGHDTIAGMIVVLPHTAANIQQVQSQMQQGLHEEGIDLSPTGGLRSAGTSALAGDYGGVFQGVQARALGLGTLSPFGGGAFIIALTTPDKFGRELPAAAEAVARSMQYFRIAVSELMGHFAGTWVTMTKSTETQAVLKSNGDYFSSYEAAYSGDLSGGGAWGHAAASNDRGRWTVRGDKQQGVITITYANGNQTQIQYHVHVERGETYWNEYWFNGDLYGRKR